MSGPDSGHPARCGGTANPPVWFLSRLPASLSPRCGSMIYTAASKWNPVIVLLLRFNELCLEAETASQNLDFCYWSISVIILYKKKNRKKMVKIFENSMFSPLFAATRKIPDFHNLLAIIQWLVSPLLRFETNKLKQGRAVRSSQRLLVGAFAFRY